MKEIIYGIIPAMVAVLLVASAGCTAPSGSSIPSAQTPEATLSAGGSGTPSLSPAETAGPAGSGGTGFLQAAARGDTVAIYYTGMFENGTVFDSNMDASVPVTFTIGNSSVLDGIDEAVTGMAINETRTVRIPAEKAYGAYNASLVRTVPRTGPIANTTFTEGQYYSIHDRQTDRYSVVKVLNVTASTVTWDGNNPLAGMNFTFIIKLVSISRP